jgi:hypothetical protein
MYIYSWAHSLLCVINCSAPVGDGPITWNYRCSGQRDELNNLMRVSKTIYIPDFPHSNFKQYYTNEYEVGLKSWRKNADGSLNREWFVSQTARAFLIASDSVRCVTAMLP